MAVEVLSRDFDAITYNSASKWVIDDYQQLHVVGENGNLASYASGTWVSVHQGTAEVLPAAA